MDGVDYDFEKAPYGIIAGGTGSGKTYTLMTLLRLAKFTGGGVYIVDAKGPDLQNLRLTASFTDSVFYDNNKIINGVKRFYMAMRVRQQEMKLKQQKTRGSGNYRAFGYQPMFFY